MKSLLFPVLLLIFIGCTDDPVAPETLLAKDHLGGTWSVRHAGQNYDQMISVSEHSLKVNSDVYTGTYSGRTFKGTYYFSTSNGETEVEAEYTMVTQDSIVGVHKITLTTTGNVVNSSIASMRGFRK